MVGYGEPCPCCGNKRRRPALERWYSSPASYPAAAPARSQPPVKFARSASAPSPSAVAFATAIPAIRATGPTPMPPAPVAPVSTSSELPAPSENLPVATPLLLPPDFRPDPTPPTTSIPALAVAVGSPATSEAKQEVKNKDEGAKEELKEGEKETKEMINISGELEIKVSFKCCKCGISKAVAFTPTDSH